MAVPFKKTSIYKKKLKKNKFNNRKLVTPLKYCYLENENKLNYFRKKLRYSNKYIINYLIK